jgi:hypothetical protein
VSGFCVDGVCCASACGGGDPGDCQACSVAAGGVADGTCAPLPASRACRPRVNACDVVESCDGVALACPANVVVPACVAEPVLACVEPVCASVSVDLEGGTAAVGGVTLTFEGEVSSGSVAVIESDSGCPPPSGFQILRMGQMPSGGAYWDIETTASYSGDIRICLHYAQGTMPEGGTFEQGLRIVHGDSAACDGTGWSTLTGQSRNMADNVICGITSSLSPFAIVAPVDGDPPLWSGVPDLVVAYATSTAGASVAYGPPLAIDEMDGALPVTCTPASGSLFPPGKTTVSCSSSDLSGNGSATTFTVWVQYQAPSDGSFFLKPVRSDGSSRFKLGRAVPVKFRLEGASAGIMDLEARLTVTRISNAVRGNVDCEGDEDGEDTDMTFRYRKAKGIYGYRWKTRGEVEGTYRLRADLGDGVTHEVDVSLKGKR